MPDDNLHKSDSECIEILKHIFIDPKNLYNKLAPNGWVKSEYINLLHPTPEQQHEESRRMTENINRLLKKTKGKEEKTPDKSTFKQDDLNDIPELEEFIYVLGLTVYDIFSNNHEVIGSDNKIYNLGSMRGSGRFIADFINEHYEKSIYR